MVGYTENTTRHQYFRLKDGTNIDWFKGAYMESE